MNRYENNKKEDLTKEKIDAFFNEHINNVDKLF